MQNIAAIDVGSNAIRMVVGRLNNTWRVEPIENIRMPVRLGGDVFATGSLKEKTMQHAVQAFQRFQHVAVDHGVTQIRAIATSALREAANSDILLDRILQTTGIEVEVISGTEEARLIHMAVASVIKLKNKRAVLIDIGGGSVEVTISENQNVITTESYNMGTVRLLQELGAYHDPAFPFFASKRTFSELVREFTEAKRRRIDRELGSAHGDLCVGTGGAVEELGRLRQKVFKQPDDSLITLPELQILIEKLGNMSVKDRIRKFNLRPDRADVILPAAIVLHLIAHEAHVRQVAIPQVGLKDGVLLELVESIKRGPHAPRRAQVWESAFRLGKKYQFDAEHATLTAKLACQLFDQSQSLHNLGAEERLLLEVAALLHDIGRFINAIDHDRHGQYILDANRVIGLNERQQAVIASLVRNHRQSISVSDDPSFKMLPRNDRATVRKLSALLRLADGLDVSHANRVTRVVLAEKKKHWELSLRGKGDLMLEKWALQKRRGLFEEIFNVELVISDKR